MTNFGINWRTLFVLSLLVTAGHPSFGLGRRDPRNVNACEEWLNEGRPTRSFQLNESSDGLSAFLDMRWLPRGRMHEEQNPVMVKPSFIGMLTPAKVLQDLEDTSPYRLNLQANQLPFHQNPFLGAAMVSAVPNVVDLTKVFPLASLNFLASVRGGGGGQVTIETDLTRRLSGWKVTPKGLRKVKYVYRAYFDLPSSSVDWVSIPFSAFTLGNGEAHDPYRGQFPLAYTPQQPVAIGFKFSASDGGFVGDTMHFAVDLNLGDTDAFIDNLFLDRRNEFFMRSNAPSNEETKELLKEAFRAAKDPRNKAFADELANQGEKAVREFLAGYGWTMKTVFDGPVTLSEITRALHQHDMFREKGEFGEVHGPLAHAKAFAAILHGMNPERGRMFLDFIADYISTPSLSHRAAWMLWDIFFDARGNGIFSNRYWR